MTGGCGTEPGGGSAPSDSAVADVGSDATGSDVTVDATTQPDAGASPSDSASALDVLVDAGGAVVDSGTTSDALSSDSGAVTDGGALIDGGGSGSADTGGPVDGATTPDSGNSIDGGPADAGTSNVDGGGPPDVSSAGYMLGECKPGAKGYNSCIIQAWLACLKPSGKCEAESTGPDMDVTWASGSSFKCVVLSQDKGVECTGKGPNGQVCMVFVVNAKPDDSAVGKMVTNGQTYTMTFTSSGAIDVLCANGKLEKYAQEEDLCSPMELDECDKKGSGGGGPACPPMFSCDANGKCPPDYSCDVASSSCLKLCDPNGKCPACTECDSNDNLCHPMPGPPPP